MMDELCPLCLKMGTNKRIKAVQINLVEALWMCEDENCPWPFFGDDRPAFILRRVGEKWGYEWQTYRRVKEQIGSIPVSTELSLYTPPVTPSGDASAKDCSPSDIASNILERSDVDIDILGSDLSARDCYAPTTAAEAESSSSERAVAANSSTGANAESSKCKKDISDVCLFPLPSIFDIDGDKIFDDKISTKLRTDSKLSSPVKLDDAVRKDEISIASIVSPMKKSPEKLNDVAKTFEDTDNDSKGIPQIRSVAKTNIDLQIIDSNNLFKTKHSDCSKQSHSKISPKDKSDRSLSSKHTTTITVDGIPPITLSYDLMDLEGNNDKNLPTTSTPNKQEKCSKTFSNDNNEELSTKIPKIPRHMAKRRICNDGKAFQKFSFNALRKSTTTSIATNESSVNKTETLNLRENDNLNKIDSNVDDCNYPDTDVVASGIATTSLHSKTIDLGHIDESVNSSNLGTINSVATENSTNDILNVSCLIDDILLDGYQNATQNLNDDWLQSFFTNS